MDESTSQKAEASGISRDAIRAMRRSYGEVGLESLPEDPFAAFHSWLIEASENPIIVEANAMVLSTLGFEIAGGQSAGGDAISTRTVLLKDVSQGGFTFFTNYGSRKAQEMELHSQVALLFPWYAMERQVSITGFAEKIERSESEDYFATRPWSSQIGAWASAQSSQLSSREELEQRYAGAAAKWPEGTTVPCPPHWGGYRVVPVSIEFWQGRYSRLHDRIRFERSHTNSDWVVSRYYP